MRQIFLPLGLILALINALVLPGGGLWIAEHLGIKLFILITFLVSGYQTGTKGLALNKGLAQLFFFAAAVSLLLAPLLGRIIGELLRLSPSLLTGLIIMSAVPPTLSSGIVITGVSKGNMVLALFLTVSLNMLGIFTLPFMLDYCLPAAGPVRINRIALLLTMIFLVLLPFIVGKGIRSVRNTQQVSSSWSYVTSSCVILVVYSALSLARHEFYGLHLSTYIQILCSAALVHGLLLLVNAQGAKALHLPPADGKALIFVASQKTFPISLAVLAGIGGSAGNAVIVCLIFHFFQLLADSLLASFLRRSVKQQ